MSRIHSHATTHLIRGCPTDVVDPDGKLDPDQVEGIRIVDFHKPRRKSS